MVSKTVRQNKEIAASISDIKSLNPALARESDVSSFAYHQTAVDIQENIDVDLDSVAKLDFKDSGSEIEFSPTRAMTYDEEDFQIVLQHFRKRLAGNTRVRFAYLTKLVLFYTRNKLRNLQEGTVEETTEEIKSVVVEPEALDGVELLKRVTDKAAELIKAGNTESIMKFLEV